MSLVVKHNLMAANIASNLNSHYENLVTSTKRLSSGLRVNTASDDAAGLAIRELMRSDITALQQGIRNTNDAISLLQTADGALAIIDEKLIRMKELAEQAATGTYDSVQRLMLDSEFQAMAAEIDRIAAATDFNGIHILDGSLDGYHDGSGLNAKGPMKIHFGTGNESAEDYYYINIPKVSVGALFPKSFTYLASQTSPTTASFVDWTQRVAYLNDYYTFTVDGKLAGTWMSGIDAYVLPAGLEDITITLSSSEAPHQPHVNLFTKDGTQLTGYPLDEAAYMHSWWNGLSSSQILSKEGFNDNAVYTNAIIDRGETYTFDDGSVLRNVTGMSESGGYNEILRINKTPSDLVFLVGGHNNGLCNRYNLKITAKESADFSGFNKVVNPNDDVQDENYITNLRIDTQEHAQQMLTTLDMAMEKKESIRAHIGALQNRLENTIANISLQAENLQAAESRISDVDVASEMTLFVRNQILTQSAVAMLSQANSMPQMALQLIGA